MNGRKVLVLGLDCAPPEIVFGRSGELPVLKGLIDSGVSGTLRSSDPPITIPAWMVMATGLDPGRLGLYGFRHRKGYSYTEMWIANSLAVARRRSGTTSASGAARARWSASRRATPSTRWPGT